MGRNAAVTLVGALAVAICLAVFANPGSAALLSHTSSTTIAVGAPVAIPSTPSPPTNSSAPGGASNSSAPPTPSTGGGPGPNGTPPVGNSTLTCTIAGSTYSCEDQNGTVVCSDPWPWVDETNGSLPVCPPPMGGLPPSGEATEEVTVFATGSSAGGPGGCGALYQDFPGVVNSPRGSAYYTPAPFPNASATNTSTTAPTITDGEVVALFDVVCNSSMFENAYMTWGSANFTIGGGNNYSSSFVEYGFRAVVTCLGSISGARCEEYDYWVGNVGPMTVTGPFAVTNPILNSSSGGSNPSPLEPTAGGPSSGVTSPAWAILAVGFVTSLVVVGLMRLRQAEP